MFCLESLKELNDTAYLLAIGGGQEKDAVAICTKPELYQIREAAGLGRQFLELARANSGSYAR